MNEKIKLLIWSKDRACQLHLLLEGIQKHLPEIFDITVLMKITSEDFSRGYYKLTSQFPKIYWQTETNFHNDTISILDDLTYNTVCLSTDDMVSFKTPPTFPCCNLSVGEVFSFRLGFNTRIQNHINGMIQPELNGHKIRNNIVSWNALLYNPIMNYGYPFSMDMHAYNKTQLVNLIQQFNFNNSTELEGNLFRYREHCPYMYSFEHSVAVNIPLNKLSNTQYEGEKVSYTMSELNDIYLSGRKISLEHIEAQYIIGCHQLSDLEFIDG
jgi:hypothetical protein